MARIVKTVPAATIVEPSTMNAISNVMESFMETFVVSFSEMVSETAGVLGSAALIL